MRCMSSLPLPEQTVHDDGGAVAYDIIETDDFEQYTDAYGED